MLHGTHFDIPEPAHRMGVPHRADPTGGIYYTGLSGRLPRQGADVVVGAQGETEFGTWSELSTVYHEGVPGHPPGGPGGLPAKAAQQVASDDVLDVRSRRGLGAVRRARLMAEFGHMDDQATGWACSACGHSRRRASCSTWACTAASRLRRGGGEWDYDKAWAFLTAHAFESEGMLRFELDRYLTLAGQAPSYKIGERLWLQLRDEVRAREGMRSRSRTSTRRPSTSDLWARRAPGCPPAQ